MMTSGAFSRKSRLSPKALRLYDEMGFLRPAAWDAITGDEPACDIAFPFE